MNASILFHCQDSFSFGLIYSECDKLHIVAQILDGHTFAFLDFKPNLHASTAHGQLLSILIVCELFRAVEEDVAPYPVEKPRKFTPKVCSRCNDKLLKYKNRVDSSLHLNLSIGHPPDARSRSSKMALCTDNAHRQIDLPEYPLLVRRGNNSAHPSA